MRLLKCDQCDTIIEQGVEPWALDHPTDEVDEDGDPCDWTEEAHFCGPACLASWAMARWMAIDT